MSLEAARQHFAQGHYQSAADLLAAWPADAEARFMLAHCWLRMAHPETAREHLVEAARLAPERAEIWHDLGVCCHELGRAEEAARAFERAASLGRPEGLSVFKVRDLVLVVDVSQQAAQHWTAMRQWVHDQLKDLRPDERFALVGFNHDLQGYQMGIFCAASEVAQASRWLTTVVPDGTADLDVLLERLLSIVPERGRRLLVRAAVAGPVRVSDFSKADWPFVLEVDGFGQGMGAGLERLVEASRRAHGLG